MEFLSFDLETTGTLAYVDRIVEIAAVRFKGGKVIDQFQALIDPGIEIPLEASKINGITDEMVRGKPSIQEVLGPFADFCGAGVLTAHNASFDFQFLRTAIEKHKALAPRGPVLDTYALAKKTLPGMSNYKLSTLVRYLKIKHGLLHRALADAECCGHLFHYMVQKTKIEDWKKLAKFSGRAVLKFPQIAQIHEQLALI